ncbi:hypothetical protein PR048_010270 [Dryococelus australis]|uniref:DUF4371 domain-containing protein n=1 Tax=Dryococelus australis TaxID=614101 RepID=A0ABQ9I2A4_9NEOP|nr:hypothetical protein PR048_010270 [Dryococelus australis]
MIYDSTRDISGDEQESVGIRWCDDNLDPHENFIGFYQTALTTGEAIASLICDALIRLQRPLGNRRGQTYDGAANMSGTNKGDQSITIEKPHMASYIHCGAQCCNLIIKESCNCSATMRIAMEWAVGNISKIKALCSTRWLY